MKNISILIVLLFGFTLNLTAQYPNIKINSTHSVYGPDEVMIGINPTNPDNIVVGANIDFYFFSFDGGLTWTEGKFSQAHAPWGDPCFVFDSEGNMIFTHLTNDKTGVFIDRLGVERSTDGGMTWAYAGQLALERNRQQDKEWLAVDLTNSAYHNNIYIAWTEFDEYNSKKPQDSSRILFSRSTDAGLNWDEIQRIGDQGGICLDDDNTVTGVNPVVDTDGNLYIVWEVDEMLIMDKSTDGGVTFGEDKIIGDQPGGWVFDIPGLQRAGSMPVLECDMSNSEYRGSLYLLSSDQRNGLDNTDVFFKKSTDQGSTWSDFQLVNHDNNSGHQFFPWMSVDPITGFIYIIYYSMNDIQSRSVDVVCARSMNGGETFENFLVSDTSFTTTKNFFLGDYIGIAAYNGKAYPVWTRIDNSGLSAWISIIDDSHLVDVKEEDENSCNFSLSENYPNPFENYTKILYYLPEASYIILKLYNSTFTDEIILIDKYQGQGEHTFILEKGNLPSGVYYYELTTPGFHAIKHCLIVN